MYKVFYNERIVFFIENRIQIRKNENYSIHEFSKKENLQIAINIFLQKSDIETLFVISKNSEATFKEYSQSYKIIKAAGGLVRNSKNDILFIFRRNKWDLPKGKIEMDETPEVAAIREVEEECGIDQLKIIKFIDITYHTYTLDNTEILKPTYWYEMIHNGNNQLKPQLEEEITEAVWLNEIEIQKVYENTFPSIINILKKSKD